MKKLEFGVFSLEFIFWLDAEVLLATLRLLVLGDGDGAAVIIGLYNGDEEFCRRALYL